MRKMTIDEVHYVALDIMKDIHEFCENNDIRYSLAYGSLIGAVRHHGFIPWDDDIDIWMTRPNFEKFTKTYVSTRGYRLNGVYDKDSLICFNRVFETKETFLRTPWKSCAGDVGVFVDIMPLDGIPDNIDERNKQYNEFSSTVPCLITARYWKTCMEINKRRKLYYELRLLLNDLKCGHHKCIQKRMIAVSKRYEFGSGDFCSFFQCGDAYRKGQQEILPVSWFEQYISTKFEDTELMIVKDYDVLLTEIYGDYMKLPPIEQRNRSHGMYYIRE